MSSITIFFFIIPILAILLLAINFIFATHTPYQEKNSAFECGFHSFLGQNRMQFNISFYIFGLLFLLFDLEILLIYPYPVSANFNSLYGLSIMIIFFLILTLGFAFELGKNALKIDSRQYNENNIVFKSKPKYLVESNYFYIYYIVNKDNIIKYIPCILYLIYIIYNIDVVTLTEPDGSNWTNEPHNRSISPFNARNRDILVSSVSDPTAITSREDEISLNMTKIKLDFLREGFQEKKVFTMEELARVEELTSKYNVQYRMLEEITKNKN